MKRKNQKRELDNAVITLVYFFKTKYNQGAMMTKQCIGPFKTEIFHDVSHSGFNMKNTIRMMD